MNKEIHDTLNKIYEEAHLVYDHVRIKYPNITINSYKGHYLKINGKYEYQHYYMPVISNETFGDICFNLDGVSFEYFLDVKEFKTIDLNELINIDYPVEIYDGNNSEIDLYTGWESFEDLSQKITALDKIGITINCQSINEEDILDLFTKISNIIYHQKET